MIPILVLLLAVAQSEPVVIRTVEAPRASSFPALELREGELGVALGGSADVADLLSAAGFSAAPGPRGRVTFVADPAKVPPTGIVVWVSSLSREQTAAALREARGIALCIVSGRGCGDPEPLRIGDAWLVQAPGTGDLWGRIELKDGSVTNRFSGPDGKPSEKVAELLKKRGASADPLRDLRESARPGTALPPARALEAANRACRLRIHSMSERGAYGARLPSAGRKLLVLDAEFENTIPMTLVQSHQVPTQYKIPELGDHLYLVVNGGRVARILADGSRLPGHLATAAFTLDRLGAQARGNLAFEIPAEEVRTLDLRFYDYAHGHMALPLRAGPAREEKPIAPFQENEVLQAGLFRAERLGEVAGKKAPTGMTYVRVEFRARSRLFTETDATAFDPKAKPGDKLQVGTVSDWTDARKHLHAVVDGEFSYPAGGDMELGEAPRFLPDLLTGGSAMFLVPGKSESLEVRCDFPNARLPDGTVVHPKALTFLVEGKRPEPAARPAILDIDDEVFKVAVLGQEVVREFAGAKPPAGSAFLRLDVTVTGAGKAGEMFQVPDQLLYATEKGAQLPMHEATFLGPRAPAKLLLVPTGERRSFQAVFAIPEGDRRPRLAYRGVSKAEILPLKPIEAAPRACPRCKAAAGPAEKFCGECGTRLGP